MKISAANSCPVTPLTMISPVSLGNLRQQTTSDRYDNILGSLFEADQRERHGGTDGGSDDTVAGPVHKTTLRFIIWILSCLLSKAKGAPSVSDILYLMRIFFIHPHKLSHLVQVLFVINHTFTTKIARFRDCAYHGWGLTRFQRDFCVA